MAEREGAMARLATRIPKSLHRKLKLYCVESGLSVMEFVTAAIEEKLRRAGGRRRTSHDSDLT